MKARSVLIVESEESVGPALSEMLHRLYPGWSVAACDPAVAMSVLRDGAVDTVVTVTAEHGGGCLLAERIRDYYPSVSYATFSVNAAESPKLSTSGLAQKIGRSFALQERLADPDLVQVASRLKRIPVIPSVFEDMCFAVASDLATGGGRGRAEVVKLVDQDPGLAAQILKQANSPIPGGDQSLNTVPAAVAHLGAGRLSSLLLGVSSSDHLCTSEPGGRGVREDWNDAVSTAQLSRKIAAHEQMTAGEVDSAYLAGLLHNVGRLMLAANMPQEFSAVDWPRPIAARLAREQDVFGVRHTDLSALLLRLWGLDDEMTEAVGFYADPVEGASRSFGPLAAVHGAVVLLGHGHLDWDKEFLLQTGLTDRIERWGRLDDVPQTMATAGF
jgi:HD-like signal output (HDOD) protein